MAAESSATTKSFALPLPVSLDSWLSLNASALKPPVSNRNIFNGSDFILQAVAGPNTRCDYHGSSQHLYFPYVNNRKQKPINQKKRRKKSK
jgi:hypothetical protein